MLNMEGENIFLLKGRLNNMQNLEGEHLSDEIKA